MKRTTKCTLALLLVLVMSLSVLSGCATAFRGLSGTMVDSSYTGTIAARVDLYEGDPIYYTTFAEAWELVNRNPELDAVITLMSDITAENNKFGDYSLLTLEKRTGKLTLDLGGFTIDKGLTNAQNDGAIFSLYNACDFTIKNGTLTGGNNSANAGCIFVDNADIYLHLESVTIKGNKTSVQGGALFISAAGCVELTDCTVEENSASENGGAFFMTGNKSTVTLNNCTVQNNTTNKNGGAMFIYGSDSTVTLNGTTVTANSATTAGGIHLDDNDGKMASLILSGAVDISCNYIINNGDCDTSNLLVGPYPNNNCKLTVSDLASNSTVYVSFEGSMPYALTGKLPENLDAASVFFADSSKNVLSIADNAVKFEAAGDYVAAVVIDNQATMYTDFDSAWNAANAEEEKTVYLTLYQDVKLNAGQSGEFKEGLALYPGDKEEETWLVFNLNNHKIDRAAASACEDGMIFYVNRNSRLILENGTLTGGKSDDQGGAVYCCDDDAVLIFRNMTVTENYAENDGSAIYIDDMESITFEGKTVIENNRVGEGGGKTTSAVNLEDGDIYFRGEIYIRNNAGPIEEFQNNLVLRDFIKMGSLIDRDSEIHITDCTTGYSLGYYEYHDGVKYSFRRFTEEWTTDDPLVEYRDYINEWGPHVLSEFEFVNNVFKFDLEMRLSGYSLTDQVVNDITWYFCYGFGWKV